jgi:hypothetical protein
VSAWGFGSASHGDPNAASQCFISAFPGLAGVCTHDGSFSLDYYNETLEVSHVTNLPEAIRIVEDHIIAKVKHGRLHRSHGSHFVLREDPPF